MVVTRPLWMRFEVDVVLLSCDLIDDESRTTIASTFSWFYIRD
jgi:hypothetical protein